MAKDADGNYYYDAGTVNEQMDNVDVYEDSDGNFGVAVNGNEMRVHEFAHLFGGKRAAPGTDELAQGEHMLFVSDGTDANTADGDLAIARNPDGTIETATVAGAASFADV
jgi:hypothetical protein